MRLAFIISLSVAAFLVPANARLVNVQDLPLIATQAEELDHGGFQLLGDIEIPFGPFSVLMKGANAIIDTVDDALELRGGNVSFFTITEPFLEKM